MENKIVERQRITINKEVYYLDSLDEDSQKLLSEIRVIDNEIQHLQIQMSIAGVAKNSILETLNDNADTFQKVPAEEIQEEENEEPIEGANEPKEPAYVNQ